MPKNGISKSRRKFMQTAAVGAGAAAIGALSPRDICAKTQGWTNGMTINPNIPNTRVVCCKDPTMVTASCLTMGLSDFDPLTPTCKSHAAANAAQIEANLDQMAMALSQKSTAAEAWSTIFMKSKANWSDVKVAIKPNANPENRPRVAIVDKVCKELNALGVPYTNMVIYDIVNMYFDSNGTYLPFIGNGLPAGVAVTGVTAGDRLGGQQSGVPIPAPYSSTIVNPANTGTCPANLANGTIDILVNIAVNKGHGADFGLQTLTMKNHFGTFVPGTQGHEDAQKINFLIGINKSNAILGGTPPRQQLCIVDALWSNSPATPRGIPDKDTYQLVMGVCSPVVDYLTIKNIRQQAPMNCSTVDSITNRFLSDFGFDAGSLTWVNVPPAGTTQGPKPAKPTGLNVHAK